MEPLLGIARRAIANFFPSQKQKSSSRALSLLPVAYHCENSGASEKEDSLPNHNPAKASRYFDGALEMT